MKETGDVEIVVGKDDGYYKHGSVADSVLDLINALPRDRRYLTITAKSTNIGSIGSGTIRVSLRRVYAYVSTTAASSEARVQVDEIAEYIDSRRWPLVSWIAKFSWILAGVIWFAGYMAYRFSPPLVLLPAALWLILMGFSIWGPRSGQIAMQKRSDAASSVARTRRELIVGIVIAIIGVLFGFLLGRK